MVERDKEGGALCGCIMGVSWGKRENGGWKLEREREGERGGEREGDRERLWARGLNNKRKRDIGV